jgi:hypothetical protein
LRLVRAGADSCTRGSYASICISRRYCSQTSSTYVLSRGEIRTNTDRCASSPRMHVYPNVFCNLRRSVLSSHPQSMKHASCSLLSGDKPLSDRSNHRSILSNFFLRPSYPRFVNNKKDRSIKHWFLHEPGRCLAHRLCAG